MAKNTNVNTELVDKINKGFEEILANLQEAENIKNNFDKEYENISFESNVKPVKGKKSKASTKSVVINEKFEMDKDVLRVLTETINSNQDNSDLI